MCENRILTHGSSQDANLVLVSLFEEFLPGDLLSIGVISKSFGVHRFYRTPDPIGVCVGSVFQIGPSTSVTSLSEASRVDLAEHALIQLITMLYCLSDRAAGLAEIIVFTSVCLPACFRLILQ